MRTFYLRRKSGQWVLKEEGKSEPLLHFDIKKSKAKAIVICMQQLRKLATHDDPISFIICKVNDDFQTEYTYPRSADPIKSKG